MPKRQKKKAVDATDIVQRLRKALAKQTKAELIDLLAELAAENRSVPRRIASRIDLQAQSQELVAATRQAIADATDFDERDINRNFDYDYEAYDEVKRNFRRLIESGELPSVLELALELMKQGSYQVEMSDEGLMTEEIEECLGEVLSALKKSSLAPRAVIAWCAEMLKRDRVGFICERELKALRDQFERLPSP